MRFSPDGHNLICGSYDAELKVWNLDTGEVTSLEGHQGPVVSLVYSSDRRTLCLSRGRSSLKGLSVGI